MTRCRHVGLPSPGSAPIGLRPSSTKGQRQVRRPLVEIRLPERGPRGPAPLAAPVGWPSRTGRPQPVASWSYHRHPARRHPSHFSPAPVLEARLARATAVLILRSTVFPAHQRINAISRWLDIRSPRPERCGRLSAEFLSCRRSSRLDYRRSRRARLFAIHARVRGCPMKQLCS